MGRYTTRSGNPLTLSVAQRNSAATALTLRVWAPKKGPLRCATAHFSGFWAIFAAKSAVA
jgi:hypothetical protein